nr:NHL repeat-containing protein 2 isoform X2 [Osmia lignaria]
MHILPDLHALEERFTIKDGLVVVGVHSAKFTNERDSKGLLSAIQRYNITHPVVNDATLSTWRDLGISCWPTLVMIGPLGELLAVFVGEGHREELKLYTDVALTYFKSLNKISEHDVPLQLARHLLPVGGNEALLFPSKLESFQIEQGEKLIISDTGNNRILVTDMLGKVEYVIGGSNPDFRDGDFQSARFNAPQGVCILGSWIFVADNENHAIRKIDLTRKIVTTVAGTGVQGFDRIGGKSGKDQLLSSPWDVAIFNHEYDNKIVPVLLVAMAGIHQIWALFLENTVWWKNKEYKADSCVAIVGNGREENRNNAYPHAAGLAQPSGLTIDQRNKIAYIADSESSAIRRIDLQNGRVSVVCGGNKNPADLHDFGDSDGTRYTVKLQHPLGITCHSKENVIYVADTYNHKIKRIDASTGWCKTLYGDGKPNKNFAFNEPSGIAVNSSGDTLYVADTNNHIIKVIDTTNGTITKLSLKMTVYETNNDFNDVYFFDTAISNKGGKFNLEFDVIFHERDIKLNQDAPQKWSVVSLPENRWSATAISGELSHPISIKVSEGNETHKVHVILDIVGCTSTECIPKRLSVVYRVRQKENFPNVVTERKQLLIT